MEDLGRYFDKIKLRQRLLMMVEQRDLTKIYTEERLDDLVNQKFTKNIEKYPEKYALFLEGPKKNKAKLVLPLIPKNEPKVKPIVPVKSKIASEPIDLSSNKNSPSEFGNYRRFIFLLVPLGLVFLVYAIWPKGGDNYYVIEGAISKYSLFSVEKDECKTTLLPENHLEFGSNLNVENMTCNDSMTIFSKGFFMKEYYQIHNSLIAKEEDWKIYSDLYDGEFEKKLKMDAIFVNALVSHCKFEGYLPKDGWKIPVLPNNSGDRLNGLSFGSFSSTATFTNLLKTGIVKYANEYAIIISNQIKTRLLIIKAESRGRHAEIIEDIDISYLKGYKIESKITNHSAIVKEKSVGANYLIFSNHNVVNYKTYIGYFDKLNEFILKELESISGIYTVVIKDSKNKNAEKEKIRIDVDGNEYSIESENWTGEGLFNPDRTSFKGTWKYKESQLSGVHIGKLFENGKYDVKVEVGKKKITSNVIWRKNLD